MESETELHVFTHEQGELENGAIFPQISLFESQKLIPSYHSYQF